MGWCWESKSNPKNAASFLNLVVYWKGDYIFLCKIDWVSRSNGFKVTSFKVRGFNKKSANRPRPHLNHSAQIQLYQMSNHSQTLTASNFEAIWLTDFKFIAMKDLNLLKEDTKNKEAGSILKVFFALSKWPHFHRAYLVTVPMPMSIAVYHTGKLQNFENFGFSL